MPCAPKWLLCKSLHWFAYCEFACLQNNLSWQHQYQEPCEKQNLLDSLVSAKKFSLYSSSLASGRTEHWQQLAAAAATVADLQRKHSTDDAWTQQGWQYQQAAVERKCFWVHHNQNSSAVYKSCMRVLSLAARKLPTTTSPSDNKSLWYRSTTPCLYPSTVSAGQNGLAISSSAMGRL